MATVLLLLLAGCPGGSSKATAVALPPGSKEISREVRSRISGDESYEVYGLTATQATAIEFESASGWEAIRQHYQSQLVPRGYEDPGVARVKQRLIAEKGMDETTAESKARELHAKIAGITAGTTLEYASKAEKRVVVVINGAAGIGMNSGKYSMLIVELQ